MSLSSDSYYSSPFHPCLSSTNFVPKNIGEKNISQPSAHLANAFHEILLFLLQQNRLSFDVFATSAINQPQVVGKERLKCISNVASQVLPSSSILQEVKEQELPISIASIVDEPLVKTFAAVVADGKPASATQSKKSRSKPHECRIKARQNSQKPVYRVKQQ